MNRILAIVFAVCLAFAAALGWMGHALTHHCPKCPAVSMSDSTFAGVPDTVRYDSLVPVRVPVPYAVHDTIHDTTSVIARTPDSCSRVSGDTTAPSGIRLKWTATAKLIVPPFRLDAIIIPPLDTVKTRTVTIVDVQYKTDTKDLLIAAGLGALLYKGSEVAVAVLLKH